MNLLETLLSSQNNGSIEKIAQNLGLNEGDAKNVIGQLLPALSNGLQQNAASSGGLESLIGALSQGNHQRYLDDPKALGDQSGIDEGNAILGHIFGSKDVSRNVAAHAASETGVDSSIIKKMLPMVATIAMGALSKQTNGGSLLGSFSSGSPSDSALGMLGSFLDANKDGSVSDDLLNMAKKFF